jgi:uncharacterized protein (TIGR02596 family)
MDQTVTSSHWRKGKGFTLLELLVVMSIMVMLMALAMPAVTSILTGSKLERAGQMVADALTLARQEAVSKNREVQVAFFELPMETGGKGWIGLQVWRVDDSPTGPITRQVSRLWRLPGPMVITTSGSLSPLLTAAVLSGTATIAGNTGVAYKAFRFRANGSTDSSIGTNNYVTVQDALLPGNPPPNYFTVQVNPITGKISIIRP